MKTVVARSHDQSHLKIREFLSIMYVGIGIKLRRKWFISKGSGSLFQRAGAPMYLYLGVFAPCSLMCIYFSSVDIAKLLLIINRSHLKNCIIKV